MPTALADWLQALASSSVAVFMGRSAPHAVLDALHIFSIAMLVGSAVTLDLRALSLFRAAPFAVLAPPLLRMAWIGGTVAVVTGALLFSIKPVAYAQNPAFLCMVALVGLGAMNALAIRASSTWRDALAGAPIPDNVRAAAFRSLLIWAGAILAGSWIAPLQ